MKKANRCKLFFSVLISVAMISSAAFARPAWLDRRPNEVQRQDVLKNSSEILTKLYAAQPDAKAAVEKSYGYATFGNFGTKILFVGSASGRGVAVNNKTQQRTFMDMYEVQAGLGLGVKSYMMIWVFESENAFNNFVNSGWEIGAQAAAAAKAGGNGGALEGAVQISPGVYVYQLTSTGLAVELTAKGTKYYRDNDLNNVK